MGFRREIIVWITILVVQAALKIYKFTKIDNRKKWSTNYDRLKNSILKWNVTKINHVFQEIWSIRYSKIEKPCIKNNKCIQELLVTRLCLTFLF